MSKPAAPGSTPHKNEPSQAHSHRHRRPKLCHGAVGYALRPLRPLTLVALIATRTFYKSRWGTPQGRVPASLRQLAP